MKKSLFILWISLGITYLHGQEFYMYVNGQKRTFEVSATKMLVKSDTLTTSGIKSEMQNMHAGSVRSSSNLGNRLTIMDMQNTSKKNLLALHKQWNGKEGVLYASPVLLDETGKEIGGFTNQVLVRLKSVDDTSLLTASIVAYSVKSIEVNEFDKLVYILTLDSDTGKNTMQIAGELYETGLFDYAEPNLIHFIEPCTNDPYFSQQWGLNNTGQFIGYFADNENLPNMARQV
jgi:hypothetical protein